MSVLADQWSLSCQTVILFTQVHHIPLSHTLFFCVSLPDRLAAALSGTVLVIEDMLTSVDRYRLPNRSIRLVAVSECVCVCVRASYVYGHLYVHIWWCISKMFGTQGRHMRMLLSFNSLCP